MLAAKGMAATGKADRSAHSIGASQAVRGFIKHYADGAFDPAVISILEDAFEDACLARIARPAAAYSSVP